MPASSGVLFYSEDKSIPSSVLKNKTNIVRWIHTLSKIENVKIGEINFIFCSDEFLYSINKQYLNHNYYTDIITFDYSENKTLSADIFISVERVKENASTLNILYKTELLRVLVHGILHLCGYKDQSKSQQLTMRTKEDFYLQKIQLV
ncbi:MAG: rRNA maturation RNase YbeY [Flavobacteriales bacterium]|nr:rRNA maturation RNase YbeY [Flavobacteriales bacterium]